jgi:acyl-CoA thioesterase
MQLTTLASAPTITFDSLTAIDATPDGGPAHATVDPAVSGFGGAHGGYVAAIALRALRALIADGERTTRALSVHLLAPVRPGDLEVHRRLEREGRSMAAASGRLEQEGRTVATALASFGRTAAALTHDGLRMPTVPTPDELEPLVAKPVPDARAGLLVEHRPAAGPLPLSGADRAEILVWMRLLEDRPLDDLLLTFLADAAPPALYAMLREAVPMPTADLTLHLAPAAGRARGRWVLGVVRSRVAGDGYAVEDGELWAPDGELLATSRQLRRVLTSPAS